MNQMFLIEIMEYQFNLKTNEIEFPIVHTSYYVSLIEDLGLPQTKIVVHKDKFTQKSSTQKPH